MYIDLIYYRENGGKVDMNDATFNRVAFRAEKLLDRYTQSRVRCMKEVPEAVKRLMVELITIEDTQGAAIQENQAVSSFSNDGYSETYAEPLTAEQVKKIENDLILTYLLGEHDDNGVPLLWLGVS